MSLNHEHGESVVRFVSSMGKHSILDGVDEFYLVVGQTGKEAKARISHYTFSGKNIERRWIHKNHLLKSVLVDGDRQLVQWILLGEIIQDPTGMIRSVRTQLQAKDFGFRQRNILMEYAGLVKKYVEAKEFLENGQPVASFYCIYQAIHHWARLAIMEVGEHPQATLWKQLKEIDPPVYKLYEELMTSREPLEKRIQLLLLALDFSVLSKWCPYVSRKMSNFV